MRTATSLLRNTVFGIVTTLLTRLANTLVFIVILRRLGVDQAGVFTVGISFFFVASRFAFWGLDHLLTREVARVRADASRYLSNFLFLRLVLGVLVIAITVGVIQLAPYPPASRLILSALVLSVLPENLNNICWAAFAAFEAYHFTSVSSLAGGVVKVAGSLLALGLGLDLVAVAIVFLVANTVTLLLNLVFLRRHYIKRWERPQMAFIRAQLRVATPFIFIGVFFILDNRFDNILLSLLDTDTAVGLFAAATAVFTALGMIPEGFRISILPVLARVRRDDPAAVASLYAQSYRLLAMLGLPLGVGTILLAEDLIRLIYRPLPAAVPALQLLGLGVLFLFLNVLNTRLLIVYDRQSLIARILALTLVQNLLVNLWLIPRLGPQGAAIARVGSVALLYLLSALAVRSLLPAWRGWPFLWKPLLCAGLMAPVVWLARPLGFWLQVPLGALVYGLLLLLVGAVTLEERRLVRQWWGRLTTHG